jgi:aromatic ring-opening dioxygenase LigB subunit
MAIAEWCKPEERGLAAKTRAAMEDLARRSAAASPGVTVVLTPHNIHVERGMAVVLAGTMAGTLEGGASPIALRVPVDRQLATEIAVAVGAAGVPIAAVSYGANDTAAAVFPMDWGTQVPLHFMGGCDDPPKPIVMVAPARDLPWDAHVVAGRAIAKAADTSGKRVALIASCDHGHAHDANGPYGYSPASKEFDDRVVDLVKRGALGELLTFDRDFVAEAKADSFWQMLMLHGALGDGWRGEFLSYEAPTYFGMLCAAYTPRG